MCLDLENGCYGGKGSGVRDVVVVVVVVVMALVLIGGGGGGWTWLQWCLWFRLWLWASIHSRTQDLWAAFAFCVVWWE